MLITILTYFAVLVVFFWMCGMLAYLAKLEDIAKDVSEIKEKLSEKIVDDLERTYKK